MGHRNFTALQHLLLARDPSAFAPRASAIIASLQVQAVGRVPATQASEELITKGR